jgi:hypothetical protein
MELKTIEPNTEAPQKKLSAARRGWFRGLCADVLYVIRRDKKWWLLPLILVLLAIAAILVLSALAGPLAPFIYPLL